MSRYPHADARALPHYRRNRDRIAEQPRYFTDDGETQADAQPLRALRPDLVILIENTAYFIARNADAGILNFEDQRIGFRCLRNPHVALLGILERIADEILQELSK